MMDFALHESSIALNRELVVSSLCRVTFDFVIERILIDAARGAFTERRCKINFPGAGVIQPSETVIRDTAN